MAFGDLDLLEGFDQMISSIAEYDQFNRIIINLADQVLNSFVIDYQLAFNIDFMVDACYCSTSSSWNVVQY